MTEHATPPRAINKNPVFDRRYRVNFRAALTALGLDAVPR